MERMLCLAIGYGFGLFQTAYLYGKAHHIDIREHGSGNAGTTNVLRVLGKKAGLIVFIGDSFKMIFACLLVKLMFAGRPEEVYLFSLYTGFGVVLGHNFPFYMNFKGGKGIAASAGLLVAMDDWRLVLFCLVLFILTVAVTRYVSLGSILVMIAFFIWMLVSSKSYYGLGSSQIPEFCTLSGVITGMALWRHRANIKRLLSGTENKIGTKKE